jgi:hypothetical protein
MSRTGLRRTGISWVIGGAVVVLLAVAGVDALRSSGNGATAPASPSPTAREAADSGPPHCGLEQIDVIFEFRGRVATNVVRHVHGGECVLPYLRVVLTIDDRAGTRIFAGRRPSALWGVLQPDSVHNSHFPIPDAVPGCAQGGPFQVRATVGSYSTHRELSANELACDADERVGPG